MNKNAFVLFYFLLSASLHCASAQDEEYVQYEVLEMRSFDDQQNLISSSESLLASKFDFTNGEVEHVLSFLKEGEPAESKTFRIKRLNEKAWQLEAGAKTPLPVSMDSFSSYQGFKYLEIFPSQDRRIRIFERRTNGTMRIVSSYFTADRKRTETSVYSGRIIDKKEYDRRLKGE